MVDGMFKKNASAKLRNSIKTAMLSTPQHVMVGAMKGMMDPSIWKDDKIDVPLQLILAKAPFWTESYKNYVKKLAPHVDYRVMDGVGHFLMMENPEAFNKIMVGFMKKNKFLR